jgi:hypothetical protein
MIRLRYPVGLGVAAATLVGFAMALVAGTATALTSMNDAISGTSSAQPSQDQFMTYYAVITLQYSLMDLVPWVVLAAALTAIGALTLFALRSRRVSSGIPRD